MTGAQVVVSFKVTIVSFEKVWQIILLSFGNHCVWLVLQKMSRVFMRFFFANIFERLTKYLPPQIMSRFELHCRTICTRKCFAVVFIFTLDEICFIQFKFKTFLSVDYAITNFVSQIKKPNPCFTL